MQNKIKLLRIICLILHAFFCKGLKFGRREKRNSSEDFVSIQGTPLPKTQSNGNPRNGFDPNFPFGIQGLKLPRFHVPKTVSQAFELVQSILLYKPPLGASTFYVTFRLFQLHRRRQRRSSRAMDSASSEMFSSFKKTRKKRRSRAFDIDPSDREYRNFGGVIPIRVEYCQQALKSASAQSYLEEDLEMIDAASKVLAISCSLQESYESLVDKSSQPLSHLYSFLQATNDKNEKKELHSIIKEAAYIGEIRLLDALLRVFRDRLLVTSRRLEEDKKFYEQRNKLLQKGILGDSLQFLQKKVIGTSLEDNKRTFVMAEAAVQEEIERLGKIQKTMLERPKDLPSTILLNNENQNEKVDANEEREMIEEWNHNAHMWILQARSIINEILSQQISNIDPSAFSNDQRDTTLAQDLLSLSEYSKSNYEIDQTWKTGLHLVDGLFIAQKKKQEKFLTNLKMLSKDIDIFGIPSSLAILVYADILHNILSPRWSLITGFAKKSYDVTKGIIIFRFWEPFRDIILDLINRRPILLEPFAVLNEQQSLDNMLRDLGVSDGTKAMREAGIAGASRLYEKEITRPIMGVFQGQLIRLLLIQVQILKSNLFDAMLTIDHLVDSNRLNIQLLASIPAFLLIKWGSRLLFTTIFRVRSRDLRPINGVLDEMYEYLLSIERCLLLVGLDDAKSTNTTLADQPSGLGEFVLLVHSYLILLDFVCPPTQSKLCESVQSSLQDLLLQGQPNTSRQLAMLQLVKAKHENLKNNLILI